MRRLVKKLKELTKALDDAEARNTAKAVTQESKHKVALQEVSDKYAREVKRAKEAYPKVSKKCELLDTDVDNRRKEVETLSSQNHALTEERQAPSKSLNLAGQDPSKAHDDLVEARRAFEKELDTMANEHVEDLEELETYHRAAVGRQRGMLGALRVDLKAAEHNVEKRLNHASFSRGGNDERQQQL